MWERKQNKWMRNIYIYKNFRYWYNLFKIKNTSTNIEVKQNDNATLKKEKKKTWEIMSW